MKKRALSLLLVLVMVLSMVPVVAGAAAGTPEITKVSMTLSGILDVNFKVASNGADMSKASIEITGAAAQTIDTYTRDGDLYVYAAKVPAHKLNETMAVSLVYDGATVSTDSWNAGTDYLSKLSGSDELTALAASLQNYGTYAAAYATGNASTAISGVTAEQLADYKPTISVKNAELGAVAALYLDDAADLLVKFNSDAWLEDYQLKIGDSVVAVTDNGSGKMVASVQELLPQNWSRMYDIHVVNGEEVIFQVSYGVYSYIYQALGRNTEAASGLNNLLKAMYSYSSAAVAYKPESKGNPIALGDVWMRDPFILNDGDAYYLYGTTHATQGKFQVYSSTDLQNWYNEGFCYDGTTAGDGLWSTEVTEKASWAPEVYAYNGAYYMFATFTHTGSYQRTVILTADSPVGPFTKYADNVLVGTDREACSTLDGTLFFLGTTPYMIYCHEWQCSCCDGTGTMEYIQLSADLKSTVGSPVELFDAASAVSGSNGVTDGPFVHTENGGSYLLWSTKIDDVYQQYQTTLTNNNGTLSTGTTHTCLYADDGGHAMTFTDMNGVNRLVLHTPNTGSNPRAKLYPVSVDLGALTIDGYKTVSDLSELNGQSGSFRLGGNITGNATTVTGFTGTLDGKGYTVETAVPLFDSLNGGTVENLTVKLTDNLAAAGVLAASGSDLTLTNVTLTASEGVSLTGSGTAVGAFVGTLADAEADTVGSVFTGCINEIPVTSTTASDAVGGLVGLVAERDCSFISCENRAAITAAANAGGLIGQSNTGYLKLTVTGGENSGSISGVTAGGIIGRAYRTTTAVTAATNEGTVSGSTNAGGIIGYVQNANTTVQGCANTAAATVSSSNYAAGIVGRADGNSPLTINGSSNAASVTGKYAGGIFGWCNSTDSGFSLSIGTYEDAGCTNTGNIQYTGTSGGKIGGIVGYIENCSKVTVSHATNSGSVTNGQVASGIVGHNKSAACTISYCINTGTVSGASSAFTNQVSFGTKATVINAIEYAGLEGTEHTNPDHYTEGDTTALTEPSAREGYNFAGWYIGEDAVTSLSGLKGKLTITAHWAEIDDSAPKAITSLSELNGKSGSYYLTGNITGNTTTVTGFTGTLDGKGFTVETSVTLFDAPVGATVQDLNVLLTANLTADGVLAETASNLTVTNVTLSASEGVSLTGSGNYAGGFVGTVTGNSTFTGCVNNCNVTSKSGQYAGGFVGNSTASELVISGGKNTGTISGKHTGGIVGSASGTVTTVTGVTNEGVIVGNGFNGGIMGYANGGTITIENCTNAEAATMTATYGGGMVGLAGGGASLNINGCTNEAAVTASGFGGGMIGRMENAVVTIGKYNEAGCVNNGDIKGTSTSSSKVGGIVGIMDNGSATLTISGAVNNGDVNNAQVAAGMIGHRRNGTATIELCTNNGTITGSTASFTANIVFGGATIISGITYDGLEGATNTNPTTYTEGATTALADPGEREGFNFAGWYVGEDAVTSLSGLTGNLTITAHWAEIDDSAPRAITSLSELNDQSGSYYLTGNITGNTTTVTGFTGTLDGKGYTIETSVTLFDAPVGATIQDLTVNLTANLTADGVLAATASNLTLTNVMLDAAQGVSLTGSSSPTGGFVGTVSGTTTITNCINNCAVTGSSSGYAGGFFGSSAGELVISGGKNTAAIGGKHSGGIVGTVSGTKTTLTGVTNEGAINGNGFNGGIVGYVYGTGTTTITDCDNTATATVKGTYVGGITGYITNGNLIINGCTNAASVTDNGSNYGGGMVGYATGGNITIGGSSNTGTITAKHAGGMIGHVGGNSSTMTVNIGKYNDVGCSNTGTIKGTGTSGTSSYIGGAIGQVRYGTITLNISDMTVDCSITNGQIGAGLIGVIRNGTITFTRCTVTDTTTVSCGTSNKLYWKNSSDPITVTDCSPESN